MMFADGAGRLLSPWHHIPLYAACDTLVHFVCTTPVATWAKMEIARDEDYTPLRFAASQMQVQLLQGLGHPVGTTGNAVAATNPASNVASSAVSFTAFSVPNTNLPSTLPPRSHLPMSHPATPLPRTPSVPHSPGPSAQPSFPRHPPASPSSPFFPSSLPPTSPPTLPRSPLSVDSIREQAKRGLRGGRRGGWELRGEVGSGARGGRVREGVKEGVKYLQRHKSENLSAVLKVRSPAAVQRHATAPAARSPRSHSPLPLIRSPLHLARSASPLRSRSEDTNLPLRQQQQQQQQQERQRKPQQRHSGHENTHETAAAGRPVKPCPLQGSEGLEEGPGEWRTATPLFLRSLEDRMGISSCFRAHEWLVARKREIEQEEYDDEEEEEDEDEEEEGDEAGEEEEEGEEEGEQWEAATAAAGGRGVGPRASVGGAGNGGGERRERRDCGVRSFGSGSFSSWQEGSFDFLQDDGARMVPRESGGAAARMRQGNSVELTREGSVGLRRVGSVGFGGEKSSGLRRESSMGAMREWDDAGVRRESSFGVGPAAAAAAAAVSASADAFGDEGIVAAAAVVAGVAVERTQGLSESDARWGALRHANAAQTSIYRSTSTAAAAAASAAAAAAATASAAAETTAIHPSRLHSAWAGSGTYSSPAIGLHPRPMHWSMSEHVIIRPATAAPSASSLGSGSRGLSARLFSTHNPPPLPPSSSYREVMPVRYAAGAPVTKGAIYSSRNGDGGSRGFDGDGGMLVRGGSGMVVFGQEMGAVEIGGEDDELKSLIPLTDITILIPANIVVLRNYNSDQQTAILSFNTITTRYLYRNLTDLPGGTLLDTLEGTQVTKRGPNFQPFVAFKGPAALPSVLAVPNLWVGSDFTIMGTSTLLIPPGI
ncbi:unnamed protein product [Closterium sp. Naga37s-1]|nr:unnamed protein product [Closterium sp. Naga37s-1]